MTRPTSSTTPKNASDRGAEHGVELVERAPSKRQALLQRLAHEVVTGEQLDALAEGAIGFTAGILVQVTMPHSDPKTAEFTRRNGRFTLSIVAPSKIGIPYGRYPRLVLAWVTTQALRSRSRRLELGDTLSDFMSQLDIQPTGGVNGTITALRKQMRRLFSANISISYAHEDEGTAGFEDAGFRLADSVRLWWKTQDPDQRALWGSEVVLSEPFYQAIQTSPVPVDMRALKALRSPFALDLYSWLGYRIFVLNRSGRPEAKIPWKLLAGQFGSRYKQTRDFKRNMIRTLKQVLLFYPDARVEDEDDCFVLYPSRLPIPPKLHP